MDLGTASKDGNVHSFVRIALGVAAMGRSLNNQGTRVRR